MSMMASQILKFLDSPKTPKSEYVDSKKSFFLQMAEFSLHIMWVINVAKSNFPAEVTFKRSEEGC